jgi:hypothetical protein
MPKTLISLDALDKAWLDREARRRSIPMTELVRQAVRLHRQREENRGRPALLDALASTSGLWRQGDGLAWQKRLRGEWEPPRPKRRA